MEPRLGHRGRVERHPRQPRPRLAVEFHLVGPDHPLRYLALLVLVQILRVGAEVVLELRRGDRLVEVTEINLREIVAAFVADVAGHVDAIKQVVHVVDAGDALAGEDVAHARLEDQRLLPGRAGLVALAGLVEGVTQHDGDEAIALVLPDKTVGHVFNVPLLWHVENVPHSFVRQH